MKQKIVFVTAQPNLPDIIRFEPYHLLVLDDHAWLQNTFDKLATNTTNKTSYQILTCRYGILQSTPFKEPDNPVGTTGQLVTPALISNVTVQPNLQDIIRFRLCLPYEFVFSNHA